MRAGVRLEEEPSAGKNNPLTTKGIPIRGPQRAIVPEDANGPPLPPSRLSRRREGGFPRGD